MQQIAIAPSFDAWQREARICLAGGLAPSQCTFRDTETPQPSLFAAAKQAPGARATLKVPRAFVQLARTVAVHRDPLRWDLLYRMVWRLVHDEPRLLEDLFDPDVAAAHLKERAVLRDIHKVHAFVRFREVQENDKTIWVAWYNPDHFCLALAAPHFVTRFRNMAWSILTPDASAHWDGATLRFGEGVPQREAPTADTLEDLWRIYYRSIFNPARVKIKAMKQEMPRRFWRALPESEDIDGLIRGAHQAVLRGALTQGKTVPIEPLPQTLAALNGQLATCQVCAFCAQTTQVVPGDGDPRARMVLVGEQPGDQEDLAGRPFVGPAGQLLDEALVQSGLPRADLYLTNAVKHFKFEPRGKRRIHQRPTPQDIGTCRPWLAQELRLIRPKVVVGMGLSAALSLLGKKVRLSDVRGHVFETPLCAKAFITEHPSAILRADPSEQKSRFEALVTDLRYARSLLEEA